ncbi:hypothetical protein NW762_013620 [Fusarium torreyae]|uniref:Uncharacterized protein n=1 Tax=Fusarium torreyae TaxID=1237075 RepID=A0A9W8RPB7_9HYPO|nr:hypothetical protein NW762_013620 [Fusarium torreyae]
MASVREADQAVQSPTETSAKRGYPCGSRFMFELLRRADGRTFNKATAKGALPFISFKIYPNQIVVECNEDNFAKSDVEAICFIGKSTDRIINAGLRSAFFVASRVHIQSGNYSFELHHNKIDLKTGTVRPVWISSIENLPSLLTRMTLHLHNRDDEDFNEQWREIISTQFGNLQETSLLFLRKLQNITVEFYDGNGMLDRSKQYRKQQTDKYRVSLETTSISGGGEMVQDQIYHVTKQTATGLAQGDGSESVSEGARNTSMAEVILAFPLSSEYKPLVTQRKQKLFALAPLQTLNNYKFHIHSDFDNEGSQLEIITTSRRNRDIRSWIPSTFYRAIQQFCEHPTLCYDWPLFLPSVGGRPDKFWSKMNFGIHRVVKENRILKSRQRNDLRHIHDVLILYGGAKDKNGEPRLDDPQKDLFISPNYIETVVDILMNYGLRRITCGQFLDLLEIDLRSSNSRMRGKDTTDEWHSGMAFALWGISEISPPDHRRLKSLPILPLRDGTWTSIDSGPVYLPTTDGPEIPESLDLRVLSLSAVRNADRRSFFQHLFVYEATVDLVRKTIIESFASSTGLLLDDIKSFLAYLYLTHRTGFHAREGYSKVRVIDHGWNNVSPCNKVVYLPGRDQPYSPGTLWFAQSMPPNLSTCLLHPDLLKDAPARQGLFHPSWSTWLRDFIGVQDRLSILSPGGEDLSHVFLYVLEHRPSIFLGFFEYLWILDMTKVLKCPAVITEIQNLPAHNLCGVNFAIKLQETWLPRKSLKRIVERYMEHPGYFPFLKVEDDADVQLVNKWNFLSQYFSVGNFVNMDFFLEILRCIGRSRLNSPKVFDLYVAIYSRLSMFEDQQATRQKIRDAFENEVIFVPYEYEPSWTGSSSCFWAAPSNMVTAHSLQCLYNEQSLSDEHKKSIENLFRRTLGIRDAIMNDLVSELDMLRGEGCDYFPRILDLYRYLNEEVASSEDMRAAFEGSPLIFVEQHGVSGWYTTLDCLWSSPIAISGKVVLNESYGELKDFFVKKLRVMSLTPEILYDELRQPSQRNIHETKTALFTLNGFLKNVPIYLDPEPVRKAKVFPVRNPDGTSVLSSVDSDFAIGDRDTLRAKFEDKISLLDFDLGDVRRLKPLFDWLRLKDRYLSRCVKETTSTSGGVAVPISSSNRDLKRKAHHITRVAATFNSPRFQDNAPDLYDQLRTMTVVEVDTIFSMLRINQNGRTFGANPFYGNEHIAETAGKLIIYVSKEPKTQEISFRSTLPRKLAAWLMRGGDVDAELTTALMSIFACERSVLDQILSNQGIVHIPFGIEDEKGEEKDKDGSEDENDIFYDALETGEVPLN